MSKDERIAEYLSNSGFITRVYQGTIVEVEVPRIGQLALVIDTLDVWGHKKYLNKEQRIEYSKFMSKLEDVLVQEGLLPHKDMF